MVKTFASHVGQRFLIAQGIVLRLQFMVFYCLLTIEYNYLGKLSLTLSIENNHHAILQISVYSDIMYLVELYFREARR